MELRRFAQSGEIKAPFSSVREELCSTNLFLGGAATPVRDFRAASALRASWAIFFPNLRLLRSIAVKSGEVGEGGVRHLFLVCK
ncbi:MAG: hypothetical protein D6691_03655 [Candidatus Hydrogenedentota bacterium]|nr:MAG: hypothetical protein D6691_03655 [Candidatus Hydrogenedentota bacterium]